MNIVIWVLQILLALHTVMGAVWKFSHSEKSVPSLKAIPHTVWIGLSIFELVCSLGLLLPAIYPASAFLAPIAAACIAGEMLLFSALHIVSGRKKHSQMIYWLGVAVFCVLIAYGRLVIVPI